MENKNHYVYVTTNLINGKQYVGDHTINPKLKSYYIGSGNVFQKAVKKYDAKIFFKEILEWFYTRKEASDAQSKYIIQFNTLVPNGYNVSPTGGFGIQGCHSIESIRKISKALEGNQSAKGTHRSQKEIENIKNKLIGIKRSQETKNKHILAWETREPMTIKTKQQMSTSAKKQKECEHCHKICNIGNYNRWHGKNCKYIQVS